MEFSNYRIRAAGRTFAIGIAALLASILFTVFACGAETQTKRSEKELPRLILQTGHTGPITCLAFSSDGKFLVTGSEDHSMIVWNLAQRCEVHRLVHGFSVNNVS